MQFRSYLGIWSDNAADTGLKGAMGQTVQRKPLEDLLREAHAIAKFRHLDL